MTEEKERTDQEEREALYSEVRLYLPDNAF
jgi:hypothetical protein